VGNVAATATLAALTHPGDTAPEPGYTPSQALADYVRCRDLTAQDTGQASASLTRIPADGYPHIGRVAVRALLLPRGRGLVVVATSFGFGHLTRDVTLLPPGSGLVALGTGR